MLLRDWFSWSNELEDKEIGIEVEMEGAFLPERVSNWSVKGDGSLRGVAYEYILPSPVRRNMFEKRINTLYDTFTNYSINPSDRCGVHIHLNCRDLEMEQIFNFIVVYLVVEDVLMRWCGDSREGNLFCLRAKDAEWMIYNLIKDKQQGVFGHSTSNETFKYASLNLAALSRYGSLEFRGLGTPNTPDRIITWTKLLLALKDYAMEARSSTQLISDVCSKTPRVYLKEIIGKDLFNEVKCPNMSTMLVDGARRIQSLAYTPLGVMEKKKEKQRSPYTDLVFNAPRAARPGQILGVSGGLEAAGMLWLTPGTIGNTPPMIETDEQRMQREVEEEVSNRPPFDWDNTESTIDEE